MQVNPQPYVGPRPFGSTDQDKFFGRNREARDLIDLVVANNAVLLHSKSGLGKTSLVNALLVPLLIQEEGFEALPVARVAHVASEPAGLQVRNIYVFNALMSCSQHFDSPTKFADISFTEYLAKLERPEDVFGDPAPRILIFDQFEELFTTYPERWQDRRSFFEQIGNALEKNRSLRVIFSMREEYIGELEPYVSLLPGSPPRFRLEGLNEQTAIVCVREPLRLTNRTFAPGVAERLVKNLLRVPARTSSGMLEIEGQFVEPVQLQIVCQSLWNSLDPTVSVITREQLESLGNVDESLNSFYESVISRTVQLTEIKEGQLRRWLERALITPAGSRAVVFRGREESEKLPNRVIDALEDQRIIKSELRGGERWYELSHDRFIEVIKKSNERWSANVSGAEKVVSQLEERALVWMREGRNRKSLLIPSELAKAERSLSQTGGTTNDSLLAFLEASALRKAQWQRSNLRWLIAALLVLFLLLLVYMAAKLMQINSISGLQSEMMQIPFALSGPLTLAYK